MIRNLIAQNQIPLGPAPLQGVGPLGSPTGNGGTQFNDAISKIIGVMTVVAFIFFTFQVVIGAIRIVASGGDKGSIEGARKQITTGIIGVVMVVAAIFIVKLIGTILGLNNILDPTCILSANGC